MTSWRDLAAIAAPYAPTIGKMLGGLTPVPGGALLGEWAGNLLAKQLGVPATPEAVGAAIQNAQTDPTVQAALGQAEKDASAEWQARAEIAKAEAADRTAQSQAINETIREEIATGVSWYHWRHLLGYIPVIIGVEVAALLPLVVFGRISAAEMSAIIGATTPFLAIVAGLLGFVANDTTRLKETAITGVQRDGVVAATVKAVKGKR